MMNRFFTLLLAASCLTAVGQVPDYVPTDGLVAWYPLNGNGMDEGLLENHLQILGATSSVDRFMNESGALYFDGGATLDETGFDGIGENSSHTISFWETHSSIHNGCILSENGGYSTGDKLHYCFRGPDDGVCIDGGCMGLDFYNSQHFTSFTAELDTWNHWVLTYESTSQNSQIFLNGILVSEQPMPTSWTGTFDDGICIGAFCQAGVDASHFIGSIDDFGIWDRPLSPLEIEGLYGATASGCLDPSACNYSAEAEVHDGNCDYSCCPGPGCCGEGTTWNWEASECHVSNPSDSNFDGCVQLTDLLDLLSAYDTCGDCGGDCSLANASSTCVDGECVIESCNEGFADYNGEALDGCESEEVPSWSCGEDLVFEGHTYATVQINGQCWFAENLRSTSYANGDAIAGNLNDAAWSTTSSGGRATFGEGASVCYGPAPSGDACNEAFSLTSYGRLYNWHAVNDTRGLCPSGWHVPSDGEWTTLTDGIGGALNAGNTLKAGSGWFNNGNGASPNGFDVFPGGQRMNAGNFQGAGTDAFFWTSTALSSVQVWFRSMGWNLPEVVRNPAEKNVGMSVRCLKD